MKKVLLFLSAFCLAAALLGCGKQAERLIPDDVHEIDRIRAAHYTLAPDGSLQCDAAAELTAPDAVRSVIGDLRSYPLINTNRPLSAERRIELTFFSAGGEELGRIWLDDAGACASTFLGNRHRVIDGDFDFKAWESLFE